MVEQPATDWKWNWEQYLSKAGCRITTPRRTVMGILQNAITPMTPQEILAQARATHTRLGLVTVYRALQLFESLGLVYRVHRSDGCRGYILTSTEHSHYVICYRCGRAIEFIGQDDLEALIARVEQQTCFRIEGHLLQLFGVCPACQAENTPLESEEV
ncbi:MAG TPA: transcriptional repressor [Chloroflexi bacterium]|nr:transcriptional repressor [Chloroflexota bacterium]